MKGGRTVRRKPVFKTEVVLDSPVLVKRAVEEPWRFLSSLALPFIGEDDEECTALGQALFECFDRGRGRLQEDSFIVSTERWSYGCFVYSTRSSVEARVVVIRSTSTSTNKEEE